MKLSNLIKTNKKKIRPGRGIGSGKGKTGGRGIKGQKSRTGVSINGFEGGQMPLQRRVPKFGFTNMNRVEYKGVNLDSLQMLVDTKKVKEITKDILVANGLVSKKDLVKVLGRGELKAKLNVTVDAFSKSAMAAIEKAGGKAIILGAEVKEEAKPKTKSAPKAEKKEEAKPAKEDKADKADSKED